MTEKRNVPVVLALKSFDNLNAHDLVTVCCTGLMAAQSAMGDEAYRRAVMEVMAAMKERGLALNRVFLSRRTVQ